MNSNDHYGTKIAILNNFPRGMLVTYNLCGEWDEFMCISITIYLITMYVVSGMNVTNTNYKDYFSFL